MKLGACCPHADEMSTHDRNNAGPGSTHAGPVGTFPRRPDTKEHSVKIRTLSAALLTATIAGIATPSLAQSATQPDATPTINVEPVRTADRADAIIERERANMTLPELLVGSKAPELQIAQWVKGDSVRGFEKGQTYVVEFWARWCGPCIAAFPHLSELAEEHSDDMTVIGVNIWDPRNPDSETIAETHAGVKDFVAKQGDRMGYTVAIEEKGKMAQSWMRAAGRRGIPSAFIVDGEGKIAWAGHPMQMDETLEKVIAGTHDLAAAKAAQVEELEQSMWVPHTMSLISDEATAERGYELAYALLRTPLADDYSSLNQMSWAMLTSDRVAVRDHKAAIALASVAAEKTNWSDPSVLDTLGRGYFEMGNIGKAIDLQQKAITALEEDLAETTNERRKAAYERMLKDLNETLEKYKNADG